MTLFDPFRDKGLYSILPVAPPPPPPPPPLCMEGETKERWLDLCAQAIIVEDPHRLLELIRDIIQILTEKQRRLSLRAWLYDVSMSGMFRECPDSDSTDRLVSADVLRQEPERGRR